MKQYKDFYFEVTDGKGKLQATFSRRWQAEKFAEEYNYTVTRIELQTTPNDTLEGMTDDEI